MNYEQLFRSVAAGERSVEEALAQLGGGPVTELGFATVDLTRADRCGVPELIYGEGKTPEQLVEIVRALVKAGQPALASRVDADTAREVCRAHPEAVYHASARCLVLHPEPLGEGEGGVGVVCAGTTDLPVADEAALVATLMGARVSRVNDAGVAGLHRLMPHLDHLRSLNALVVVAGMEGALPSVVGGLVDVPLVAVPTSVGYGSHMQGLTALMAMLNSCVPGLSVVNVDNGIGAGVAAARINQAVVRATSGSDGRSI